MTIFDRYLFFLVAKVLLVCFLSMAGLYVVIDSINNMDEFLGLGKQLGGVGSVLIDYYGARIPWFFDRSSALLALIAAMCAVTWLQRTNELTAVMAAGIPKRRVIRPLIVAAVLVAVAAAANREAVLPSVRDRLARNAQNWLGQVAKPVQPVTDYQADILLNGKAVYASQRRIEQPTFQLYQRYGEFGRHVQAQDAFYREAEGDRPSGYLLEGVTEPAKPAELGSVSQDGRPVILTPRDHSWLKPDQLFVASEVGFEQLASGSTWRRYASTWELIAELRNPSLDFGLDSRVMVHARVVQPFLDLSLFFLGLPLVLTRENRNIFVAAGWCFLVVLLFFVIVVACQTLGTIGYLVSPSLAAWLPLLIFAPLAAGVSYPIWED
jgi:lipopolysaccharide export system permease protein